MTITINTINDMLARGLCPQIEFLYGKVKLDASDSTFTDTTAVFSATSVVPVHVNDVVDVVSPNMVHSRGIVQSINAGTKTITVDAWQAVSGGFTMAVPDDLDRVLVRRPGVAFSYTVDAHLYTPIDVYTYATTDVLTFVNLSVVPFELPRTVATVSWDFGDGVTSVGDKVSHQYSMASGNIRAVLRVQDNMGKVWTSGQQIYVNG